MTQTNKIYKLEADVISIAEEESIKILARGGNSILIDIEDVEKRSYNEEKEGIKGAFSTTLDYLNDDSLVYENGIIKLKNGGRIITKNISKDKKNEVIHLTNSSATKSKLKRQGLRVEKPSFLHYGPEILDKSIIKLTEKQTELFNKIKIHNKIRVGNSFELSNITGEEYMNNQIIKMGSEYYRIKYNLIKEKSNKKNYFDTGRYSIDENKPGLLELIIPEHTKSLIEKFKPRNLEQKLGFQQSILDTTELNLIVGGSGSGKSVLTYAAAIQEIVINNNIKKPKYDGIILFKSNDIIGGDRREMGFLPGSAYEKVKPYLRSYVDAHNLIGLGDYISFREMLTHPTDEHYEFGKRESSGKIGNLKLSNKFPAIEIEHLQFARGRTFENKIIFVDEAQNYTPFEIKQLIERVGINSKIYLVGDPNQIDNPLLNPTFNGLTYVAAINYLNNNRMTISKLTQNYRSGSAEIIRDHKAPGQHL